MTKEERIRNIFIRVEKELARDTLRVMGLALNKKKLTKEQQEDVSKEYMYSQGAYDNCKHVARILNIKYPFRY